MPATGSGGLGQSRYQMQRASAAGSDSSSTVPATGSVQGARLYRRIQLVGVSARGLSTGRGSSTMPATGSQAYRHDGLSGSFRKRSGARSCRCRAVTVQVGRTAVRCQLPCSCSGSSCSRVRAIRSNRRAVIYQRTLLLYQQTTVPILLPASQPAAVQLPAMHRCNAAVALRPATSRQHNTSRQGIKVMSRNRQSCCE